MKKDAPNAEALRLRGLLYSATASGQAQIRSQAGPVFDQRQALLESLMSALPPGRTGSDQARNVFSGKHGRHRL